MLENKLPIAKIILVLIILLSFGTVMGVIGYSLSLKKSTPVAVQLTVGPTITPTIEPTPTPDNETADWKTYRNEEYRYEVKYPNDWSEQETEKSAIHFKSDTISCDIYAENKNNQTVQQWIQNTSDRYEKIKDITVDSMRGLLTKDAYTEGNDYNVAIFPHVNNKYMMLVGCNTSSVEKLENLLSNFKFIK